MFLLLLTIIGLLLNARPETQLIANPDYRAAALLFSALNAGRWCWRFWRAGTGAGRTWQSGF